MRHATEIRTCWVMIAAGAALACASPTSAGPTTTKSAVYAVQSHIDAENVAWDGTGWDIVANHAYTGVQVARTRLVNCPIRDEVAVGIMDTNRDLAVFTASNGVETGSAFLDRVRYGLISSFAMEYEQLSGELMVVYTRTGSNLEVPASVTAGTPPSLFSAPILISGIATTGSGNSVQAFRLASQPHSNEIMMLAMTNDTDYPLYAAVWDGSAWGATTLLANTGQQQKPSFDAAYLPNGSAIVAYGTNGANGPSYRTYSSGTWSAETALTTVGSPVHWAQLAVQPGGYKTILCVGLGNRDLYAYVYDGSSWSSPTLMDGDGSRTSYLTFSVAWQPDGKKAVCVFDTNGTDTAQGFRTFDGTSWSTETTLSPGTNGNELFYLELVPQRFNHELTLVMVDLTNTYIYSQYWDGSAFQADTGGYNNILPGIMTNSVYSNTSSPRPVALLKGYVPGLKIMSWSQVDANP